MNLQQLHFVSALASTKSFTAAAEKCHVTQPTLSNGIALLEEELGGRLFLRSTRKVSLTPFGIHVLPSIMDTLTAQATILHQTRAFLHPDRRLIRVGTSPLISSSLLSLINEPFLRENPDIDIVLREMNMADLYSMLQGGGLDFVVGVAGAFNAQWDTAFLYQEPLLYMPPLAEQLHNLQAQSVKFRDIADNIYVMVPDACGLARATRTLFRNHRCELQEYSGEAMGYHVLEEWAMLGIGAAILPQSKVSSKSKHSYNIIDKDGEMVTLSYEAVWLNSSIQSPHLIEFSKHLRNVVPSIIAGLNTGLHQL